MAQANSFHDSSPVTPLPEAEDARPHVIWRYPNNLPLQLSSFIGREKEVGDIKPLLWSTRLLTLTGPGGCGKTRLALKVAEQLCDAFSDGVWFVELAPLSDPALVPQAVASTFYIHEQSTHPLLQTLIDFLQPRDLLLVLDNCEHLIAACARFADAVLRICPNLRILATSREVFNVTGEIAWPVPPLSLPDQKASDMLDAVRRSEAAQLFVERAASIQPTFASADQNATTLAQICARLDGMPLAIELAAARVKTLSVEQIANRLDNRFHLLTGGSRTALLRHQTLRATIDWSYDLLNEDERCVLRRLSVFAGGWTLEAAESVCADRGQDGILPDNVLDLLTQLVNKSLIISEREQGKETRYRMLETIRQYAQDKLVESVDEAQAIRNRHLDYFIELVEQAGPQLRGHDQVAWLDRLEQEFDNLRAAAAWSRAQRVNPELGLRLVGPLFYFWRIRGSVREGYAWATSALARAQTGQRIKARADASLVAGYTAIVQLNEVAARLYIEEAVNIYRQLDDTWNLAHAIHILGSIASWLDGVSGQLFYEDSLALRQITGDPWAISQSLMRLGRLALSSGQLARAHKLLEEALRLARQSGDRRLIGLQLCDLAELSMKQHDEATARIYWKESLITHHELNDIWGGTPSLIKVCLIESQRHDPSNAVNITRVLAAVEQLSERYGSLLRPADRDDCDRIVTRVRMQLDDAAFEAAWGEGRLLTLRETIASALAMLEQSPVDQPDATSAISSRVMKQKFGGLTAREREVAALIAQGQSNRDIAATLVVSKNTVATHVANILSKLEFSSRTQIVAWALDKGLAKPRAN